MSDIKSNKDLTPRELSKITDSFLNKTTNGVKTYEDLNKLPYMLWEYRTSAMKALREKFMQQLHDAQAEEKKRCAAAGTVPIMQGTLYQEVVGLVEKCRTIFDLEALARFLFDENEIPSWTQIQTRSRLLESALGWNMKQ